MTEDDDAARAAAAAAAAKRASKRLSSMSTASSVNGISGEEARPSLIKQGSSEGYSWAHKFERLVVVRAPPSQLRHPLNLQVQLINTSATAGHHGLQASTASTSSARSSMDLSRTYTEGSFGAVAEASVTGPVTGVPPARPTSINMSRTNSSESGTSALASGNGLHDNEDDEDRPLGVPMDGGHLSRTASVRSNRSSTSLASSTGSGFSSTRKVLPCYNLEFHSLQPSVITDAGTDAKIARIHKRGVEVLDLAMLDPVFPHHAQSIPPLAAREEARKSADLARQTTANSSSNASGSGNSIVSDLKPANLLSKFKRFSFRGTAPAIVPSSSSAGGNSLGTGIPSSTKESKRSSWLGGSPFSSSSPSSSSIAPASSSAPTQPTVLPVVPLFREKGPNDPGLKGLPDGLNVKITKHSPGYTWLVRHYLRKDLVEAKEVADISIEWRKKQRRRAGAARRNDGNNIVIKDLSKARAESRASSRRGSVQMDPPDKQYTPNRTPGRVPTTHIQTPSDEAIPAMMPRQSIDQPETPTRISRSVDLPRASSVPMEANSRSANAVTNRSFEDSVTLDNSRRGSVDAGRASPLGAGRRAADMLSPNLLGRYRTAPNTSQHKHSASTSSQTTVNHSIEKRQERSSSPATYMMQTAAAATKGDSNSDLGHGDTSADLDEEDEDSDPEDSERPWICELIIKRYSPDQHQLLQSAQRILLGTLTPAPHHPKLVAHLAIPLTLIPTNIGPIQDPTNNNSLTSLNSDPEMFSLSIEEMKDLMTVTALWLVVRENLGLGGIHKARKNDGAWRFATPAALKGGRG